MQFECLPGDAQELVHELYVEKYIHNVTNMGLLYQEGKAKHICDAKYVCCMVPSHHSFIVYGVCKAWHQKYRKVYNPFREQWGSYVPPQDIGKLHDNPLTQVMEFFSGPDCNSVYVEFIDEGEKKWEHNFKSMLIAKAKEMEVPTDVDNPVMEVWLCEKGSHTFDPGMCFFVGNRGEDNDIPKAFIQFMGFDWQDRAILQKLFPSVWITGYYKTEYKIVERSTEQIKF